MTEEIDWHTIIKYHCIPTEITGIFWMPSEIIYIYSLVKKHDIFHEYIKKHEKRHYNNSRQNLVNRFVQDVLTELSGDWNKIFNNELKENYDIYKNELYAKNETIIKEVSLLMKKLREQKPTTKMRLYSTLVTSVRIVFWGISVFSIVCAPIVVYILLRARETKACL